MGAELGSAIQRVLARQIAVRVIGIPIGVITLLMLGEQAMAARFALVGTLLWVPWAALWRHRLRHGTSSVWWLSLGDTVFLNVGLVQFGGAGWIAAQLGAIVIVTAVGLTGHRLHAQIVAGAALLTGVGTAWFVDLPSSLVAATLLSQVACSSQVIAATASVSHELSAAATAAALEPGTQLPTRTALIQHLAAGLADGRQVTVSVYRLSGLDELASAFGRDHADRTLRDLEPLLSGPRGTFVAVVDSSTIAVGAVRAMSDTTMIERSAGHVARIVALPEFRELGACAGWAVGPTDAEEATGLVRIAERAARTAADAGETHRRASGDDAIAVARRLELLASLQTLASSEDFAVRYQPQICVDSRQVVGVEALARWTHPRLGPVRPDEFIHLAEIAGLLPEITMEVLDRSIRQIAAWQAAGLELTMSVNVSVVDLQRPSFCDQLFELWQRHGVDPGMLILEITETQTTIPSEIDGTLRTLADAGVRFAIDDFGTGHSSLLRVRDLPVTELKIDRTFIGSMLESAADEVIVASTMQLGRTLGLEIVAEGVEDEPTLGRLAAMGCERAQGYLVSPAVPAAEIAGLCARWSASSGSIVDAVGAADPVDQKG